MTTKERAVDLNQFPVAKEYIEYYEQFGYLLNSDCHQIISRNNDINGNPYRLIIAYLSDGARIGFEARSSKPNIIAKFPNFSKRLLQIHVTPKEYKQLKGCCLTVIYCN